MHSPTLEMDEELQFGCDPIQTPKIFDDTVKLLEDMEKRLGDLADDFADINRSGHQSKAKGSKVSFIGSMVGFTSMALAPFTAGASLGVAVASGFISWKGSQISSAAESKMVLEMKLKHEESKTLFVKYEKQMKEFEEFERMMDEVVEDVTVSLSDVKQWFVDMHEYIEKGKYKSMTNDVTRLLDGARSAYSIYESTTEIYRAIERCTSTSQFANRSLTDNVPSFEIVTNGVQTVNTGAKAVSTSANFVKKGTGLVKTTKHAKNVPKATKMVSTYRPEKIAKEAGSSVSKSSSMGVVLGAVGIGLAVTIAAVELWQIQSAVTASESTCDAEKELRASVKTIKNTSNQVQSRINDYKNLIKEEKSLERILECVMESEFDGKDLLVEIIGHLLEKIKTLKTLRSK